MLNEPAEDTLTATQVAKTFNMTVWDFNHVLSDMGIQYRRYGRWYTKRVPDDPLYFFFGCLLNLYTTCSRA